MLDRMVNGVTQEPARVFRFDIEKIYGFHDVEKFVTIARREVDPEYAWIVVTEED